MTIQVRMLDNVLMPPSAPARTAQKNRSKTPYWRRLYRPVGDALIMLRLKYNSDEGVAQGEEIARQMRDAAYLASVELAKEMGAFPAV